MFGLWKSRDEREMEKNLDYLFSTARQTADENEALRRKVVELEDKLLHAQLHMKWEERALLWELIDYFEDDQGWEGHVRNKLRGIVKEYAPEGAVDRPEAGGGSHE